MKEKQNKRRKRQKENENTNERRKLQKRKLTKNTIFLCLVPLYSDLISVQFINSPLEARLIPGSLSLHSVMQGGKCTFHNTHATNTVFYCILLYLAFLSSFSALQLSSFLANFNICNGWRLVQCLFLVPSTPPLHRLLYMDI